MAAQSLLAELSNITRSAYVQSNKQLIQRTSPLFQLLVKRARRDAEGDPITFGVVDKRNTGGFLAAPDSLFPEPQMSFTKLGTLQWTTFVEAIRITGREIRTQHGVDITSLLNKASLKELPEREQVTLLSLVNTKLGQAIDDQAFQLTTSLYEGVGVQRTELTGLKAIVDNSTSAYAGLAIADFDTDSVTNTGWWTPKVLSNSSTNRALTPKLVSQMITAVRRGVESPEDIIMVMNDNVWEAANLMLSGSQIFSNESKLADFGFDAFKFGMATGLRDPLCPNNAIYYLNLNHIWLQIRKSADLDNMRPFETVPNQDIIQAAIVSDIQVVCNDRHRQGKIADVAGVND